MGLHMVKAVPTPEEIRAAHPMDKELQEIKAKRDAEIKKIFTGESDKFIAIIGPCSGYKGMLHQPNPEDKPDFIEGVKAIRKMHIKAIRETGLTAADEMLYTDNWPYLEDILSYVAIGARSVENQAHRLTSSGIDVPVGMKNPTSGDFAVMLNSCVAAQAKHTFLFSGYEAKTDGNPLAHCILRGSLSKSGRSIPNYHYEVKHLVKGVMVESYIEDGNQPIGGGCYGKSITDPCLGWKKTERLLLEMAEQL